MTDVWAEAVRHEPATYDMTAEDYAFTPLDGGMRGSVACWNGRKPSASDVTWILRNGERSPRYQVTSMDPRFGVDPPTMWIGRCGVRAETARKKFREHVRNPGPTADDT